MRKLLILLCLVATMFLTATSKAYAYWANGIGESVKEISSIIQIGQWLEEVIIPDEWNLDIWEEENNTNHTIPENQLFSYDGEIYMSINGTYNPYYHGLPGEANLLWAFVATELEWRPNQNYRTNSVVIRNGRYFIANADQNHNWFVNDPLTHSGTAWSEWREIELISEEHFGFLQSTQLRDYADPDWNYIIYK